MQTVDELKKEYFEKRKLGNIKSIHMSIDYYLQLVADSDVFEISPRFVDFQKDYLPFFGIDPVVHYKETDKPYWFEIEPWSMPVYGFKL